jgi:hypothetical protein
MGVYNAPSKQALLGMLHLKGKLHDRAEVGLRVFCVKDYGEHKSCWDYLCDDCLEVVMSQLPTVVSLERITVPESGASAQCNRKRQHVALARWKLHQLVRVHR